MKNRFSTNSANYEKFRPDYPKPLYDYIFKHVINFNQAWDCATGSGQAAKYLSTLFKQVEASDLSNQQLKNAYQCANIHYHQSVAESSPFTDNQFDLVTVAQAFHWFNFDRFFREAKRVLKPSGILAVWTYGLFRIDAQVDAVIDDFYWNVVGPYWDDERKHVDRAYQDIKFPFKEVLTETFFMEKHWSRQTLIGYIQTWSSVKMYQEHRHENPLPELEVKLAEIWTGNLKKIEFPLTVYVARNS